MQRRRELREEDLVNIPVRALTSVSVKRWIKEIHTGILQRRITGAPLTGLENWRLGFHCVDSLVFILDDKIHSIEMKSMMDILFEWNVSFIESFVHNLVLYAVQIHHSRETLSSSLI